MTTINKNLTLCIMCRRCCGGCAWSKNLIPVDGWTAKVTYKKDGSINRAWVGWVGWCPLFKPDAGLYDRIVHGDEQESRFYLIKQYGFISLVRYKTIRYHLINKYRRAKKRGNKTNIQSNRTSV